MPDTRYSRSTADAARDLKRRGFEPTPLNGKQPTKDNWQNRTIPDELYDTEFEGKNPGVVLGARSGGLVDVDLDHGLAVKLASSFLSPSDCTFGRASKPESHREYRPTGKGLTDDEPIKRIVFSDVDGTLIAEIRGNGCQTMGPGSTHPNGEFVEFVKDGAPTVIERAKLERETGMLAVAVSLTRAWDQWASRHHDLVLALAGALLSNGIPQSDVENLVSTICTSAFDRDIVDRLRAVSDTANKIAAGYAVTGFTTLGTIIGPERVKLFRKWLGIRREVHGTNDIANGVRLVERYGDQMLFCPERGGWLVYDYGRWVRDTNHYVNELAKDTALAIKDESKQVPADTPNVDEVKEALDKWSRRSRSMTSVRAMIEAAHSDEAIVAASDTFDADKMMFNVKNGTINLRTGSRQPHDPTDRITKISPVTYDSRATCPRWDAFLLAIMDGNPEMVGYLQRVVGYCLTGKTDEQVMFIPHGDGSNGKSTFIDVLDYLFGNYSMKLPTSTLMHKRHEGGIPNDLAKLPGARFVVANETSQGGRLDEATIKDLTGGDSVAARFMRAEWFDFVPTHKLFLYGNYKPLIKGTDNGIWRRLRLIPFPVTFEGDQRIGDYAATLKTEMPGILNWAIAGCLAWLRSGLNDPALVLDAVKEYRSDMDIIGQFLGEGAETGPKKKVAVHDLYAANRQWAKEGGEYEVSNRVFGLELTRRGIGKLKSNGQVWRTGLELSPMGDHWRNEARYLSNVRADFEGVR